MAICQNLLLVSKALRKAKVSVLAHPESITFHACTLLDVGTRKGCSSKQTKSSMSLNCLYAPCSIQSCCTILLLILFCREAARARKAEEVRQQRVHRARLLKDQQAAMSAHQARLQAANLMRIRYECFLTKPSI